MEWPKLKKRLAIPCRWCYQFTFLSCQPGYASRRFWLTLVDGLMKYLDHKASVAQLVELLICNQWVGGSSPFAGSKVDRKRPSRFAGGKNEMPAGLITKVVSFTYLIAELLLKRETVGFPSGQREQTVNLSAMPSEVQILPPPPHLLIRRI